MKHALKLDAWFKHQKSVINIKTLEILGQPVYLVNLSESLRNVPHV